MTETAQNLPKNAIEIKGLEKTYISADGKKQMVALKGVDLAIPRGSIFALLGPNGAGKSTLINILAGTVIKSSGDITVWGRNMDENPRDVKSCLGIVPQEITFDPFFTPAEMMHLQTGYFGIRDISHCDDILQRLGLADKKHARMRSLSGGMRRRLLVAKALVHNPPILILDEPTAGVDIELRQQLWDYVRDLNSEFGVTVLLTTHYLEEAQQMCDTIAVINNGEIVACDNKDDLLKSLDSKIITVTVAEKLKSVPKQLSGLQVDLQPTDGGTALLVHYAPSKISAGDMMQKLLKTNLTVIDMSTEDTDLEDIFMSLTQSS